MKKKPSIFSNKQKRLDYLNKIDLGDIFYKRKNYTKRQFAEFSEGDFRRALKSIRSRKYRQEKKKKEIGEIFTASRYLGIWWATTDESFSISEFIAYTKTLSNETLINNIRKEYENAINDMDGSYSLHGFYLMYVTDSEQDLIDYERQAKSRGYTKSLMGVNKKLVEKFMSLQDATIQNFVLSNRFTKRGFLVMIHSLIFNLLNVHKRSLVNEMEIFLQEYCPSLLQELKNDGLY